MVEPGGPAGSSRSTAPSSSATRSAYAVTSLVTDAQRKTCSPSPWRLVPLPAWTSTAAAWSAPQSSIRASASTAAQGRDTSSMEQQAYPSSITDGGFAAGGSVLDHKFGQSDPYTLGVEEEYMLLDDETFDLVQHIDTVLDAAAGHELGARLAAELMQSTVEIATPVCRTTADVERELRTLRSYVGEVAHENGLRVGSAGTHPFSLFERQRITARDRYRALVDQMQYVARRELIFGM